MKNNDDEIYYITVSKVNGSWRAVASIESFYVDDNDTFNCISKHGPIAALIGLIEELKEYLDDEDFDEEDYYDVFKEDDYES